ncbi:hypothetical protein M758_8G142100 [Ceratodon purpureus]|uniref:Uncharacterized protein n=1 Tax=Ceratodon purpureus TaxID=3225 RepID=A0A8T0H3F4_CERPU|nr:hypothetical protein KC19_8G145700 [Ceratodon purpureus]KAG0608904.1 hypothetical protein M758_8G142100 [Ceratodon purpureus]
MVGMFEPFRALGYITDSTPFAVQRRGAENFVTVSVGNAFQVFNCAKLTLVFVGPQLPKKIQALVTLRDFTYVATGFDVVVFRRAHQVARWSAHMIKLTLLLEFGQQILSIDASGRLCVWEAFETASGEEGVEVKPVREWQFRESFTPTCIMHPDTYLNKVLIGSEEGPLQLWNTKTCSLVHEFKGWNSPVRCCTASPALDIVAVGCANGKIYVHNLRYDETVVSFTHTGRGPVTALSFRTDGQPFLAAGGTTGVISIWNLEKRKLQAVVEDAHISEISSLQFLASEPVLLSGGADNSLKMWIFDTSDGEGRLLRFRNGHSAPPTCVRYYGNGRHILSAGQDRSFRVFSTIQDQQSRELSQGHLQKRARSAHIKEEELKLPPVIAFDAVEIRERDWSNIVTCHMDSTAAYSWRLQKFAVGEHILRPSSDAPTPIKSCTIAASGDVVVLGTEGGRIEKFNLQSGLHRGIYEDPAIGRLHAHNGAVNGLASDSTNTLLTSGGYDGVLKVWDFKNRILKSTLQVGSPVGKMTAHRGNGLIAVAADDKVLRVFDVVAGRLVRRFPGHTDRITDMCFSEDGKLLLSSSMDFTIRVWDVIAAKQVDAMQLGTAVTALSLSPGMDMLATSHVNRNGIYMWANRLMYSGVEDLTTKASEGVRVVSMPTVGLSKEDEVDEDAEEVPEVAAVEVSTRGTMDIDGEIPAMKGPSIPHLVTLTLLPKTQWKGLINLDIIKVRNKPIAPPKKPEKAPFFLPTMPTLSGDPIFIAPGEDGLNKSAVEGGSKTVSRGSGKSEHVDFQSVFLELLYSCAESKNYTSLVDHLKSISPSEVDATLRMMQIVDEDASAHPEELQEISMVMDFLLAELVMMQNFQFIQALLQVFLKVHADTIVSQDALKEKARSLWEQQRKTWQRLDNTFQKVRCTVNFVSNMHG